MTSLKLALDWTPNINHIGFYVAKSKGFYEEVGINLEISSPLTDDYEVTPAKKVELGLVDFALCPTESIISYRTKKEPFPLVAIAAILQQDLSAIVTKKGVGIDSPKDLDGKLYSSYQAKYEDGIVKEMIRNDGGQGDLKITYPRKLGIWNTLISGESDATWIFMNWEGIEAHKSGLDLNFFKLKDYEIPYSYSPVIAANEQKIEEQMEAYKAFLKASKRGFLHCNKNPKECAEILRPELPENDKNIDLDLAIEMTKTHFGAEAFWGIMKSDTVEVFLNWLSAKGLESDELNPSEIFTNSCL